MSHIFLSLIQIFVLQLIYCNILWKLPSSYTGKMSNGYSGIFKGLLISSYSWFAIMISVYICTLIQIGLGTSMTELLLVDTFGLLVRLCSKKQRPIAFNSTGAKYRTVASAIAETIWDINLSTELQLKLLKVPSFYCDNAGATYLCANPIFAVAWNTLKWFSIFCAISFSSSKFKLLI